MQQLRNDYSLTFPPLSIARYSFIQLSRLRRREVKENAQTSKRYQRGFEPGLSRLRVRHSTTHSPHTAWIVLCIFYCASQGHFWLIVSFFFRSLRKSCPFSSVHRAKVPFSDSTLSFWKPGQNTGYVSRYHKRRIIIHMYRDTRADVISTADNVENRCKKTCSMYNI